MAASSAGMVSLPFRRVKAYTVLPMTIGVAYPSPTSTFHRRTGAAGHDFGSVNALAAPPVKYIASLTATARNFPQLIEVLAPQGKLGLIDDPASLDVVPLKRKAASLHWEFMFARSMWQTEDMAEQGRLLDRVAELVDRGELRSTQTQTLSPINVENLKEAHALSESGKGIGKVTLSGF